jgi:hypothetical protein
MTNRTKITLAAALIAAFATPALAQENQADYGRHYNRHQEFYSQQAPRFIEGRNAGAYGYYTPGFGAGAGTSTSRDAMVNEIH